MLPGADAVASSLRRAKQVPSTAGKRWARMRTVRIAERQGSQWTTWPRGTLRQPRYFRSTTHPAADAARVRRDGDRRCQTMSGAGRHAWRPSRQRLAAPTDAAKISSLLPVKLQKEVYIEKVVDSRRPSPCCCSARAATLLASGHCASLWCEFRCGGQRLVRERDQGACAHAPHITVVPSRTDVRSMSGATVELDKRLSI